MSNLENERYAEQALESFKEYVANEDWKSVDDLFIEIRDNGFDQLADALYRNLSPEQEAKYKEFTATRN